MPKFETHRFEVEDEIVEIVTEALENPRESVANAIDTVTEVHGVTRDALSHVESTSVEPTTYRVSVRDAYGEITVSLDAVNARHARRRARNMVCRRPSQAEVTRVERVEVGDGGDA